MTARADEGNARSATLVDHLRATFLGDPDEHLHRFLVDGEGEPLTLSNADVDRRARAIAQTLSERLSPGDRALVLCPSGLDYMASFYGCLYAGVIAVPMYPPNPMLIKRTMPRLLSVIADAQPAVVLATREIAAMAGEINAQAPSLSDLRWITVDDVDPARAAGWKRPAITPGDVAFLQYTSGSTGQPKGVMVTHANLVHNLECMDRLWFDGDEDGSIVTWLPPYHDMGLIGTMLLPAFAGHTVTTMSPTAFLKKPLRWLRAIDEQSATVTGAPNFAFELCMAKVTEEERASLDLSRLRVAFSGAEPVRRGTMDRFCEVFGPCGFRPEAFFPAYGLAEGTLMVSGGDRTARYRWMAVDNAAYANRRAERAAEGARATEMVGCGSSISGQDVVIVDGETRTELPEGGIGEIWVRGPSVASGYWKRIEESERIFDARIAGTGDGPYLRTGDLGFLDGDELYIAGRIKDVIIIAGENRYPQDIEQTVERLDPVLRPSNVAFSVDVDGEERLVLVQEAVGNLSEADAERAFTAIRTAVARDHGLDAHEIVLVRPGGVPKTSSGKVSRSTCKKSYLDGSLTGVARWSAAR